MAVDTSLDTDPKQNNGTTEIRLFDKELKEDHLVNVDLPDLKEKRFCQNSLVHFTEIASFS